MWFRILSRTGNWVIATTRGLDHTNILLNIQVLQPKHTEQESCIKNAYSTVKSSSNSKVKLLIVDSMMFHYIAEYPGRSGLSKRAHSLNIYMHMLHNLAQTNKNIAVLILTKVRLFYDMANLKLKVLNLLEAKLFWIQVHISSI